MSSSLLEELPALKALADLGRLTGAEYARSRKRVLDEHFRAPLDRETAAFIARSKAAMKRESDETLRILTLKLEREVVGHVLKAVEEHREFLGEDLVASLVWSV